MQKHRPGARYIGIAIPPGKEQFTSAHEAMLDVPDEIKRAVLDFNGFPHYDDHKYERGAKGRVLWSHTRQDGSFLVMGEIYDPDLAEEVLSGKKSELSVGFRLRQTPTAANKTHESKLFLELSSVEKSDMGPLCKIISVSPAFFSSSDMAFASPDNSKQQQTDSLSFPTSFLQNLMTEPAHTPAPGAVPEVEAAVAAASAAAEQQKQNQLELLKKAKDNEQMAALVDMLAFRADQEAKLKQQIAELKQAQEVNNNMNKALYEDRVKEIQRLQTSIQASFAKMQQLMKDGGSETVPDIPSIPSILPEAPKDVPDGSAPPDAQMILPKPEIIDSLRQQANFYEQMVTCTKAAYKQNSQVAEVSRKRKKGTEAPLDGVLPPAEIPSVSSSSSSSSSSTRRSENSELSHDDILRLLGPSRLNRVRGWQV